MATTITVLGDGGWGTTLALHLHRRKHRVTWWSAFPAHAAQLARRRENVKFLPGIPIPTTLRITADLQEAVERAQVIVLAAPSEYMRSVVRRLQGCRVAPSAAIVSVAKGLETASLKRMSEVIREELKSVRLAVLSGPNIAVEIARGHPASTVIASPDVALARELQEIFSDERLRAYASTDVAGVELGGALKNPIAIAAGIGDGLGLGANAKAALITRGVVEMARLGAALGARRETFWGLSGLGDLITTCMGGRNRALGEQLGKGKTLAQILAGTEQVIEGVHTSKAAVQLAARHGIELPIIEQVNAVLFRRKTPRKALQTLMQRSQKDEAA